MSVVARAPAPLGVVVSAALGPAARPRLPALPRVEVSALADLRRALSLLRDLGSVDDLFERLPSATARLGFERVVLGVVDADVWCPVSFHGPEPKVAGRPLDAVLLDPGPERAAAQDLTPVLVTEGSIGRLIPVGWCPTYLTAPVVLGSGAVGLLHAGCPGRPPDGALVELLWTFCETMAPVYAAARTTQVLRSAGALIGSAVGTPDRPTAMTAGAAASRGPARPPVTDREREVLELMATGLTNAQIARRLGITEGTAKCHVRRIMRKLDAANRAEAVAAWMRPAPRQRAASLTGLAPA